jgi:hypothetical protein
MVAKSKAETAAAKKKTTECRHKGKFACLGSETIHYVTCLDCGGLVGMGNAFNVMAERMETMTDRALAAALLYEEKAAKL